MNKLKFNHLLALVSTMTLASGSQAVYAQGAEEPEEIVITGFRASLQNSIAEKQKSSSIVEAVYAEDIGKLPDTSIAETLARLPGLAGARSDGRTSGVSLRGFNENYVGTTMNGRELLGIGDNRGVEFDLYPSEIVAGATVYKTPDATLVTQGLGGVIDFKTLRPLDKDRIISLSANYEQNELKSGNPDFDDNGHRVSFTYSDKFADDTLGIAVTLASLETPSQEQQFRAWGYDNVNYDSTDGSTWEPYESDGTTIKNAAQAANPDRKATGKMLGGQDSYIRSSLTKRDTFAGVIQFKPTDSVELTGDLLYVDFSDDKVFRGFEEGFIPGWVGGATTVTVDTSKVSNGLINSADVTGFKSVIRNDAESKEGKLTSVGLNGKFQVTDAWALSADLSYGKSEKDLINIETYSGTGRDGSGAGESRRYTLNSKGATFTSLPGQPDYSNPDLIYLAGPQNWGGAVSPVFVDPDGNKRSDQQDGFVNNPTFDEELTSLRLQADGEVEFGIVTGVTVGANYSDRTKEKVNYGAFLTAPEYYELNADGSYVLDSEGQKIIDGGQSHIPQNYVVGTTDLSFLGLGKMIAYDGLGLYKSGYYSAFSSGLFQSDRMGDTYEVTEKVATLFGMAKFETGILTGNIGLQAIQTDQSSSGYDSLNGPANAELHLPDGAVVATKSSGGKKYVDLLPSLNMNFQLTDEQVVRFAAAKTQSRARIDEMKAGNTIGFDFDVGRRQNNDPKRSAWSSRTGNPELRPYETVQFDLSYEYYFAKDGLASISYFHKNIQNWNVSAPSVAAFNDKYFIEGYHDSQLEDFGGPSTYKSDLGPVTTNESVGHGYVSGTEVQVSLPFHVFADVLDGFGVTMSTAFMSGEIVNPRETDISKQVTRVPGMSDISRQLTAYYEKNGFEFRISGRKRTKFLSEERGLSLTLQPTMDLGAELWDAQIGYDFSETGVPGLEGLNVRLQVQNLTDEDTVVADTSDSRLITKYQHFGANYLLGVTYKF